MRKISPRSQRCLVAGCSDPVLPVVLRQSGGATALPGSVAAGQQRKPEAPGALACVRPPVCLQAGADRTGHAVDGTLVARPVCVEPAAHFQFCLVTRLAVTFLD